MIKPRSSRGVLQRWVVRLTRGAAGVGVLALIALTAVAPNGALATGSGAGASSACPNETVEIGLPPEEVTLRVVSKGSVSCDKALRLTHAYFHDAASGKRCEGTRCIIQYSGRWSCSYFSAAESQETGGAIAGCYQTSTRARVRLYEIPS